MKAERLLEHFDRLFEVPDTIAGLRKFILELAVRGKLTPQDPTDEPVASLIASIEAEQIALPSILKMRAAAVSETLVPPFQIPKSWKWIRLIDLLVKFTDGTHHSPQNHATGDFMYITAKNIKAEGVSLDQISYIDSKIHREIYSRCDPRKGDILYIKDGATTGTVTINNLDEPFSMLSSVALLRLAPGPFNRLIVAFLRSPFFYQQMRGFMKGAAITRLTLKRMAPALIPLPPLAEQHRIMAKVDELMGLCDRLEAAQAERERRRDRFAAASLARLNRPSDDRKELRHHIQFQLDHLQHVTARLDQIPSLRQVILSLAVSGKLVAQDSNENAAPIFDDRLAADTQNRLDMELPTGWSWACVSDVAEARLGKMLDKAKNSGRPYLYLRNTNVHWFEVRMDELKSMSIQDSEIKNFLLREGDVLICEGGHGIGRTAVWRGGADRVVFQKALHRVRPSASLDSDYFAFCMAVYFRNGILERYYTGVGIPHFTGVALSKLVFPLPPIAEQRRIVARVEQLMAVCDKLDGSLSSIESIGRKVLEATLHQILHAPNAEKKILPLPLVALKFASRFPAWRVGGDRKRIVKSLAIAQRHLGVDFGWSDYHKTAGPHNGALLEKIEADATAAGLLEVEPRTGDVGVYYRYKPKPLPTAAAKQLAEHFGDKLDELNRLADLTSTWTSEQAELYATIYAVWNDLMIDKKPVSDAIVVAGVRKWSPEKAGKFSSLDVEQGIAKLRELRLIPQGLGPRTKVPERGLFDNLEDFD